MSICLCDTVTDEHGIEILEHGTASFPAAFYLHNLAEKEIPWHWHEEFEVLLVKEGAAFIQIGKEKFHLTAGKGMFINSGTLHHILPAEEGLCLLHSICWHPRLSNGRDDSIYQQKYTQELLKEHAVSHLLFEDFIGHGANAILYFSDAWEKVLEEPFGYEFDVRHDLSKLLLFCCQTQRAKKQKQTEKELRIAKRMKQMMTFIKQNYQTQITIEEIADSAGISVSECLRCFRAVFGTTPIRYTRTVRLEHAAGMLRKGSSVSECSNLCGFEDMSYFAREFKKQYGCKPVEYRTKHKQKRKQKRKL